MTEQIKMKIRIIITIFSLFSISMQAQNVETLINELENGSRLDTLISINPANELDYIPLTLIKGEQQGPTLTIIAGIHGYEYPPIIAIQNTLNRIDPEQLKGTLVILPIANVASFYKRSPFVNPSDNKNLNTTFPGSSTGSITEKIANWITTQIIPISDVFLDIHGGDASEDLIPFICYYDNKDANTSKAKKLSDASNMEYIVSYPYNITKTEPAKYAFKQAVQDNVVALSIEAGKLGTVQSENVELIKDAINNILSEMGMYKCKESKKEISQVYLNNQSYVKVPVRGLFYSSIKSGDTIRKDQNIGQITDDFGNILQQIISPTDGIVLYKIGTPPVNIGETLYCIGY